MWRRTLVVAAGLTFGATVCSQAQEMMKGETTKYQMIRFTVRIENISNPDGMKASDGTKWSFAMSSGLCIVHTNNAPVFSPGKKDRGKGLEMQAENGNPAALAKSLTSDKGVNSVVTFNTPLGAQEPEPIGPGAAYECRVEAAPGSKLTVTSMFGQSNDLFYAPNESGIALFHKGKPISGDITSKIVLWVHLAPK